MRTRCYRVPSIFDRDLEGGDSIWQLRDPAYVWKSPCPSFIVVAVTKAF